MTTAISLCSRVGSYILHRRRNDAAVQATLPSCMISSNSVIKTIENESSKAHSVIAICGEFVSPSTHSLIAVFFVSGGLFLLFVILPLFYFWFLDP
uniref:Uncharacterized protein n=1 Tax=Parascaris univalens TaxID=6257 RepID=A0A914ZSI2_PARUN